MAITEHASSPAEVTNTAAGTTLVTASFSPPAGSLVVALAAHGWDADTAGDFAFSDSSTGSWATAATTRNTASFYGRTGVGAQYFASAPGSITVTATFPVNSGGGRMLVVKVLQGVDPTTPVGVTPGADLSTSTTDMTVSVTPTYSDGLVYGVSHNSQINTAFTPNANTTEVYEFLDNGNFLAMCAWKSSAVTVASTPVTLGETGSTGTGSVQAIEIHAAAAGISGDIIQALETDSVPGDLSKQNNFALPITVSVSGGGAHNVNVAQAVESTATQAVTHTKQKAVGLVAETTTGQAVGAKKDHAVGLLTHVSTAQALTVLKVLATGLASETVTGQALGRLKSVAAAQTSETDTALAAHRQTPAIEVQLGLAWRSLNDL